MLEAPISFRLWLGSNNMACHWLGLKVAPNLQAELEPHGLAVAPRLAELLQVHLAAPI